MKKTFLLSIVGLSMALTIFAQPAGVATPKVGSSVPLNVAQRVDLTKFTPDRIQADLSLVANNPSQKAKLRQIRKEGEATPEVKTYFAVQQSMYSGYSFAYMNGDILTWNVDVTIDGTVATISNLFDLDNPDDIYNSNTENDIVGVYDAEAKTITVSTPTEFENATIVGSFYGVYPAVMFAGEVGPDGTLVATDTELVFHLNDDASQITTDQHYGCSMYAADGSMSWGVQECFAKTFLAVPTEDANIISFADAIDFGEVYVNYPVTSTFKLVNAGNAAGDVVASIEGEGFTVTPETVSIEPLSLQEFTVTYTAPEANQEYEGIITLTTDSGDLLVQLMGTSIDYPDYSAIIKGGEMELTTGMEYPFALDDTLLEGVIVGKSTVPGGTGGNVTSYLVATFNVPEGQIGTFSWKGLVNSATWYMAWANIYFDNTETYAYQYAGVVGADISNQQKFAPGTHFVKFEWFGSMYGGGVDDILYVYDLLLELEDAVDYKVSIADNNVDFGKFIIDGEPIESVQTIQLYNEGKQPLKVLSATSTDNFSIEIPEAEAGLLEYLPVQVKFNATQSGTFEGDVCVTTTAGDITIKNKAFVRDMPDFSQIVKEGEFMFETNADNPYIVENGVAYNSTSKVLDTAPTVSRLKCSFTVPEGKLGVLSWNAEFNGKSSYNENYEYLGGESATLNIVQNMNAYTWMVYGTNGGEYTESMSSEAMIAKSDEWTDYSRYTKFTPGTWSIEFVYNQGGDNEYLGEDRLTVSDLSLVFNDFSENQAEVDLEELDFGEIYEGQMKKATIKFTNTGSSNLEFLSAECDGQFTVLDMPTWGIAFLNSATITVEFAPTEEGIYSNDLVIKTTAGDFVIKCSGEALSTDGFLLFEDFEDNAANWVVVDNDGDGLMWDLAWNLGVSSYVHSGEEAICSMSYNYNYGDLTPDNWAISPEFIIPAKHNTGTKLTWWIAAQLDGEYLGDKYSVYIIDKPMGSYFEIEDWTELYTEETSTTEWLNREVEISQYAGKTCRVAFRHHDCEGLWMVKLDDVIVVDGTSGINEMEYGKVVVNQEYYSIDGVKVANPENGIYILKTYYEDGTATAKKVVLNN